MPRVDDNNKAFPRVICTLRGSRIERETERKREKMVERTMDERRRDAVSHRFEASLQFMTRVGLRGTSRVKGG